MAPPTLTAEQLAKAAERKAAKLAKKALIAEGKVEQSPEQRAELERRRFMQRPWLDLASTNDLEKKYRVKIITWNILAQTLVRRELFPGSDCLKWSDRRAMLQAELEHHGTNDIICLQECDRLDAYIPSLPKHSHVKASGRGKMHGLVIFYRSDRFVVRASKIVYLDEEELSLNTDSNGYGEDEAARKRRRGGSRQTKNIGLIVSLQDKEDESKGITVAITHLFWHPKYGYERVRQSIILLRNIRQFQQDNKCESWPAVFAGDLNTQPSEATYQLLVAPHQPLSPSFVKQINQSRVVHDSVIKIAPSSTPAQSEPASTSGSGSVTPSTTTAPADEKDDEEGGDEAEAEAEEGGEGAEGYETVLANTRHPRADDGILTAEALIDLVRSTAKEGARSAYGSTGWTGKQAEVAEGAGETFDHRKGLAEETGAQGGGEPAYTCFTALFRLTLDYLLLLPPIDSTPGAQVTSLLSPPRLEQLGEGLPRKGICASDHLAMGCEISW